MTGIIDGKAFAAELRARVATAVSRLESSHGLIPGLAVVLVGENPASTLYVRNKGKQTVEVGMASFEHRLSDQATECELLVLIDQLNSDPTVHGILVQLPLPAQINTHAVINAIDPDKDVDGFHLINVGRLTTGESGLVPCTPLGCMM
ncbi:MAG: bifunctional methylenetetrahydrofolate dehydrogenase/methenyltetrahydrofolate cyclohydrolase, partial [Methylococcales bacterium]|nr:bifunctional methylenetetrahydrofolate dehydrogenase/methenyltetrahydrofolate cyclohydrolase [Methylococcales bacterium]